MTRRLPLALATLAAALAIPVVGPSAPATAAPECTPVSVEASTKDASAVFAGTVESVERLPRTDGQSGALYDQTVTVNRVYQGRVTTEQVQVQTDRNRQQCSLGELAVGTEYMFFTTGSPDLWYASGNSGTQPYSEAVTAEVENILGPGSPPIAPTPETAQLTPLDTTDPTPLTRAAAPGAAMVLVGLLGLVVVQGLRRRR